MNTVTKEMTIKEVLDIDHTTAPIMMEYGMHCMGCPFSQMESLEMGIVSGHKEDKSGAFTWSMGEHGAPMIDEAKLSVECEVVDQFELESFDHFICKMLETYANEGILNAQGRIDYDIFKPVLFEGPTMGYYLTGEKVGDCGRMNQGI